MSGDTEVQRLRKKAALVEAEALIDAAKYELQLLEGESDPDPHSALKLLSDAKRLIEQVESAEGSTSE